MNATTETTTMTTTLQISARKRDGGHWGDCEFRARSLESACRTAARKLGLRGPVLTRERVGASEYLVNVNGVAMMLVSD